MTSLSQVIADIELDMTTTRNEIEKAVEIADIEAVRQYVEKLAALYREITEVTGGLESRE